MPGWDSDEILKTMDDISEKLDNIEKETKSLNTSGSSEETTINAWEYLNQKFEWADNYYSGRWTFNDPEENPMLARLNKFCTALLHAANKSNGFSADVNKPEQTRNMITARKLLSKYTNTALVLTTTMLKAYNSYWTTVKKEIQQMNRICVRVFNNTITANNESVYWVPEIYSESVLEEVCYSNIEALDEAYYYQAINDTIARMSIYTHKYQMKAMNEEALIFAENGISDYEKFNRLVAVQEALGDKIKRGWYNAIAAIKEIFRKFMEKLNANFTTTKHYLDQYKNIILKANFNPNDTYKTQDLGTGINRVLNTEAPAFNFNDLVNADCDSPGKFFENVYSKKARIDRPINDQTKVPTADSTMGDINQYFKAYFCMEGHEKTYTGAQFQREINNFYNFLYDIKKINQSIKKSIRDIEDTASKIMKQAGVDVNKPAEGQQAPAQEPTPTSEAVYSILYQKWFTLNEDGILVEAEINKDEKTDNAPASQNIKNVAQKPEGEDDSANIKNTERSTVDTKVKAYVDVCTGMLKAKMSACEFIRNELMQIIRNHVQAHIGNKAANPQQTQQQPQQQEQPQEQPQQQQQTQQAKPTLGQRVRNAANAFRGR